MAPITKRGPYQYRCRVTKNGHAVSKTFSYRKDADAWGHQVEAEFQRKGSLPVATAQRITFREAAERYRVEVFPRLAGGGKTESSRLGRLIGAFGDLPLAALETAHAASYRDQRLREGASPQTVKHEMGLLGRVLKQCEIDWSIPLPKGIITAQVRKPALPPGRDRRLREGEEERLLDAARASRCQEIEPIIIIALETAARRQAIAKMRWEHIDLNKRTWYIPLPNSKTTARTVPLSSRAVEILRALPRRIDGRVWALKRPDGITQAFDRVCRRGGIEGLHFHDLRHEATSRLFEKGLNIMEVASITGHKDLKMLRRYTHLRAEDLAAKLG